jgi:hypothetical protein
MLCTASKFHIDLEVVNVDFVTFGVVKIKSYFEGREQTAQTFQNKNSE